MKIPNDTGGYWRKNKLVEYIYSFPDEIGPLMKEFFKSKSYDKDRQVWWIFLYSTSYCMGTACVMAEKLNYKTVTLSQLENFWAENKKKLLFQSDRRPVKNMNQFTEIVWEFLERSKRNPWEYLRRFFRATPEETYETLHEEITSWRHYGDFSAILFMYNTSKLLGIPVDSPNYDWTKYATTTAALFNADYQDERADSLERKPVLSSEEKTWLDSQLKRVMKVLKKRHPERKWTFIGVTSDLCSYRKLFKKTRYLGYYVDRQQEELSILGRNYPEYKSIWSGFWNWRKQKLPKEFLGELNGWEGVQKERYKAWVTKGVFR